MRDGTAWLAGVVVLVLIPANAFAGIVTTTPGILNVPSANGAWRYSESPSQFPTPGLSTTYFPTLLSEYASAVFKYYVLPDPVLTATTGGDTWFGNGDATFQIFSTFVMSAFNQSITISVAGDDGHSLFVDNVFRSGTPFGQFATFNVALQAGVPRKIEMAGYNGPANWVFVIGRPIDPVNPPANNPQFNGRLETIPGLTINADGNFATAAVPEPATLTIWGLGMFGCAVSVHRRRRRV